MDISVLSKNKMEEETPEIAPQEKLVTKDPRKVAAGKRGAAARKSREAERLSLALQQAVREKKRKLAPEHEEAPPPLFPMVPVDYRGWTPWIIGVAGVVVVVGVIRQKMRRTKAPAPPAPSKRPETNILKNRDPFYME